MGQFPDFLKDAVRPVPGLPKSNKSPYDKSTIVSIFPQDILEYKHTIQPNRFVIPAGTMKSPSITLVGQSSWYSMSPNDSMPPVEIICSSAEVADAVVSDYIKGMVGVDVDIAAPGLFWINGEHDQLEVITKYSKQLKVAEEKQKNWYKELVKQGDALWVRSGGNPVSIWDLMRIAARELNLNQKPWLADAFAIEKVKCFACGSMKDATYPVCPVCRIPDPNHPMTKTLPAAVG